MCSRGGMGGREERRRHQGMAVGVGEKRKEREKGGKEEGGGRGKFKERLHTYVKAEIPLLLPIFLPLFPPPPSPAASRTNAVLRTMLGERVEPGLATAGFTTKKQTAIAAQNAAMKREARKDHSATITTRTLPSGRKETTITNRKPSPAREITQTRTEPIKHSLSRHLTPPRSTEQPVAKSPSPKASPKHTVTQPGGRKGSGMASGGKGSRIPTPLKSTASKSRIPTKQSSDKLV